MAGYRGEPRGVAVCVVHVEAMRGEPADYAWVVSNPRRVKPFAVRGWAALYYVRDRSIVYLRA